MDDYLNSLLYFLGYGDPVKSKIFAFGIEERLISSNDPESLRKVYRNKFKRTESDRGYALINEDLYNSYEGAEEKFKKEADQSLFYTRVAQISNKVLLEKEKVTSQLLGSDKSKVFIGNYSFIARKGTNHSRQNIEEKFFNSNVETRREVLKKFFSTIIYDKDKFLFTFGMMNEFLELIGKDKNFEKLHFSNSKTGRGKYYYKERELNVYLFYHPSFNWLSENQIESLSF
jgi:hypothetical protein